MNLNEKIAKELYGSKSGDFAQQGYVLQIPFKFLNAKFGIKNA